MVKMGSVSGQIYTTSGILYVVTINEPNDHI